MNPQDANGPRASVRRILFRVPGKPVGQPRVRHALNKATGGIIAYGDKNHEVVAYRAAVGMMARQAVAGLELGEAWLGPVEVSILFVMPRSATVKLPGGGKGDPPPGRYRSIHKPDVDNLCKAVLDGITSCESVWHDDCQVVKLTADKWHAAQGEAPFTMVEVRWV